MAQTASDVMIETLAYRGVSHVTMPVDVQSQTIKSAKRSKRNIADHVSDLMAEGAHSPTEDQVARTAAMACGLPYANAAALAYPGRMQHWSAIPPRAANVTAAPPLS